MKVPLAVGFEEKEEAKINGAQWDAKNKSWYLWDYKKLANVKKWLNLNYNIYITENVFLVTGYRDCWKCKNDTKVYSMGADKFALFDDEHNLWKFFPSFYLFQYIELYSKNIINILDFTKNNFRLTFSKTVNNKYLMNNCEYCGAPQGDNFLYEEIDSVFSPSSKSAVEYMTVKKFPLELDVGLKGHLYSSYNNGLDSNKIIWDYARRA
jgi:hypothetical protein